MAIKNFLNFSYDPEQDADAEINDNIVYWISDMDTTESRHWLHQIDDEWILGLIAQNLPDADDDQMQDLDELEVQWTLYASELIGWPASDNVKDQAEELGLRIG